MTKNAASDSAMTPLTLSNGLESKSTDGPDYMDILRDKFIQKARYWWNVIYGRRYLLLVLLGTFFNAVRALLSKMALSEADAIVTGWTERTIMMLCCVFALIFNRTIPRVPTRMAISLVALGAISTVQIISTMFAFQLLNVGDAGAIIAFNTVIVGAGGWLILAEKLTKLDVSASLSAVGGVIILSRPTLLYDRTTVVNFDLLIGFAVAIVSAFCIATSGILKRLLCLKNVDKHISLFYIYFIGSIFSSIVCTALNKWHDITFSLELQVYILIAGTCGYVSNLINMLALCYENAYTVFVVNTSSMVILYLLQFIVLAVPPDLYSITGSLLIVMGVIIISRDKKKECEENKEWMVPFETRQPQPHGTPHIIQTGGNKSCREPAVNYVNTRDGPYSLII